MTPLSLGAASASQAPGAASPPRAGSGADKDAAGFDALLQAAPQPPAAATPRPKPAARPAADDPGRGNADPAAAPAPADAAGGGETAAASDAGKPAAAAEGGGDQDDSDDDAPQWPPAGLAGLLPATTTAPAVADAVPLATRDGGALPRSSGAASPAASTAAAAVPTALAPPPAPVAAPAATTATAMAAAAAVAADAEALAPSLPGGDAAPVLPGAPAGNAPAATDPGAGAALFGPLLQNLASVAEARPAPAFPPALSAPVDMQAADFDDAIGARVGWLADQKIGHAHIRVTPNDLGPVEVKLQLDGDRVHATFSSAHAEVRQALESGLPRLREMLGEQGLQLAQADVGHRQSEPGSSNTGGSGTGTGHDGEPGEAGALTGRDVRPLRLRGLLDAYA
ncbi:MAG: flagellar hook-length control protein FliK [Stenotrophomonas acidaminiphila]